ncbi:AsmA family protein, partial [Acidovorax sp. SRB_24]
MPHATPTPAPPPSAPAASARPPHRALRWVLGTVAAVLVLLAVVLVVLSQWDWNRARPWINAKVSDTTGRHFAIEGDLTAQWQWPQPLEPGWQRWIPGVTV